MFKSNMKKTTMKISYDLFWEIERIRVEKKLKSKDEVLRYIIHKKEDVK